MRTKSQHDPLLSIQDLQERYDCSRQAIEAWIRDARLAFPKSVMLRQRRYFHLSGIEQFERRFAAAWHGRSKKAKARGANAQAAA
jgi:hypothetical protein